MKKTILSLSLIWAISSFAQTMTNDWHLKYSPKDTVFGINLYKALKDIPQPANAKKVIVAVIDNGIDIKHSDLKANIWTNTKEIPGNSVDDDHNGYIDDINGWDFLGNIGKDIDHDNLEMTRLLRNYKEKFGNKTSKEISKADKAEYKKFLALQKEYDKEYQYVEGNYNIYKRLKDEMDQLIAEIGKKDPSLSELEKFEPKQPETKLAKAKTINICNKYNQTPENLFSEIDKAFNYFSDQYNYHYNLKFDPRKVIGDNYLDVKDNKYGNNEVGGPDPDHGSHVAGIIGAVRDNNIGMDGICPLIEIMVIRVVPNGDERDKDVALAIRYAVDNGAKIINMSFGKAFTFNKAAVDEAVKYAESKDVLLVHAAGNDGKNLEKEFNYPTPMYLSGGNCSTWIEVGASSIDQSPANFSNYGKTKVNVFAPGVDIYSTVPNEKYDKFSGTSMASPVVAGVAALIRAYYPNLTAAQVKFAIESTVNKPEGKFVKPGERKKKTKYKKLCTTAGIVDVYAALKAASEMK
jgi:subtilisin family serine protease